MYETPSDSSQQQWQPWKSQDSIQAESEGQEKYHPVTFDAPDTTQQKESQPLVYNANIQSGASGVAEVLSEQSVRGLEDIFDITH